MIFDFEIPNGSIFPFDRRKSSIDFYEKGSQFGSARNAERPVIDSLLCINSKFEFSE